MLDIILRAKHWQIFTALTIPSILQMVWQFGVHVSESRTNTYH